MLETVIRIVPPEEASVYETSLVTSINARVSEEIRQIRNNMLSESDWTQVTDAPLTPEKKILWTTYRQMLRDITLQSGFPFEVQWPQKPL